MILAALPNGLHHVPAAAMQAALAMVDEQHRSSEPLFLAAASGAIDCITLSHPQAIWPTAYLRKATRPVVVLIGDDPGNAEGQGGPGAWRCTDKASAWAAGAVIHAAGGEAAHYCEGVRGALALQRVVFIETTSIYAQAWRERIACPSKLLYLAHDMHPIDSRVVH